FRCLMSTAVRARLRLPLATACPTRRKGPPREQHTKAISPARRWYRVTVPGGCAGPRPPGCPGRRTTARHGPLRQGPRADRSAHRGTTAGTVRRRLHRPAASGPLLPTVSGGRLLCRHPEEAFASRGLQDPLGPPGQPGGATGGTTPALVLGDQCVQAAAGR